MGRSDMKTDPRFATNAARMSNNELVQQVVRDWVGSMPRAQVLAILDGAEVVAAAVNDASDIAVDPHFRERTLHALTGSTLGPGVVPGPVLHLDGYAGPSYDHVPQVGEHTHEVLAEIAGMAPQTLAELAGAGVLAAGPALVGVPEHG
jgi:crotonobetainyl-CoA:carnitine CoA-transferase CaiB-like acyl-CoA transferase